MKVLLPNIKHIIFCEFTKLFDFQIHRIKRMNLRIATDCKWNHLLLPCFSSCKYHVLKKKDLHKSFPGIDIPLTFPSEIIPALFPYYAPDIFFLQITDINLKKFVSPTSGSRHKLRFFSSVPFPASLSQFAGLS